MRVLVTHLVAFILGLGAAWWHLSRTLPRERVAAGPPRHWPDVLARLGIKSGDLITAVEGSSDPSRMMVDLVAGYQKGSVCVDFTRDGERRRSCFQEEPSETGGDGGAAVDLAP